MSKQNTPENPVILKEEIAIGTKSGETLVIQVTRERVSKKNVITYQEGTVRTFLYDGTEHVFTTATNGNGSIKDMFRRGGSIF